MKIEFPNSDIFGYLKSEGILGEDRDVVFDKLRDALRGRVEAAYVFGSFARGDQKASSDLDLMLIKNTDKKFLHRVEEFEDLYGSISPDLDIVVYTPEEFEKSLVNPAVGFWSEVARDRLRLI
jgi:predicted nucleotidyltransferase